MNNVSINIADSLMVYGEFDLEANPDLSETVLKKFKKNNIPYLDTLVISGISDVEIIDANSHMLDIHNYLQESVSNVGGYTEEEMNNSNLKELIDTGIIKKTIAFKPEKSCSSVDYIA